MDCLTDAVVSAAAAGVRDRRVDIRVRRVGLPLQQRERAHDHSGLAVAALRRIEFLPGDLDRMGAIGRKPFNCGDSFAEGRVCTDAARSYRLTVDMHGAGAALSDAATELRARQAEVIADHP